MSERKLGHCFVVSTWFRRRPVNPVPAEEALRRAGLDWEVRLVPVFALTHPPGLRLKQPSPYDNFRTGPLMCLLKNPEHPVTGSFVEGSKHPTRPSFFSLFQHHHRLDDTPDYVLSEVSGQMAVVREDMSGDPRFPRILGVVSGRYVPLQNRDGLRLFQSITIAPWKMLFVSGGYFDHGALTWLQAYTPGFFRRVTSFKIKEYLLFVNSHDGSAAVTLKDTSVLVEDWYSLKKALNEKTEFYHLKSHYGKYNQFFRDCKASLARFVMKMIYAKVLLASQRNMPSE
jgi:hypothetical protein